MHEAKVIADSISKAGHRVTSIQVTMPRFILAEFNTHRTMSRNSASSRAIPVQRSIERVTENPFVPKAFSKNQRGMQADSNLDDATSSSANRVWMDAINHAVVVAEQLRDLEVHKQHANRVIEPYAWHTLICTATEWSNFFALRCDKNAQPEMQETAGRMKTAYEKSEPVPLADGEWHLPYVDKGEELVGMWNWQQWARISAARCARVSTLTQEGKRDIGADLSLYDRLVGPGHLSPLEHPCRPMTEGELEIFRQTAYRWEGSGWSRSHVVHFLGNVNGWVQLRKLIPGEHDFSLVKGDQ